jgi:hypothetical protein
MGGSLRAVMLGVRTRQLSVLLGLVALLTLIGGPDGGRRSVSAAEVPGSAGSEGITASLVGTDAVLATKPGAKEAMRGQRARPPRAVHFLEALSSVAAMALVRRRLRRTAVDRPRMVPARRAGEVRAPPLLQPA